MHAAGPFISALLALAGWALVCTLFGTAMIYGALKIIDAGKVRTAANSVGGVRRESGRQSSVLGSQTSNQTNSLQNPGSIDRTGAE